METLEIRLDEAVVSDLAAHIRQISAGMGERMDADESIFFARELEHIKAKEFDVDYPELKARTLIPISTEVNPGAETITYRQYDMVGAAKIIKDYADDLPSFDALGKEFTAKIVPIGGSYSYSLQELRAAIMAKRSIDTKKQQAAVFGMRKFENDLLLLGDSTRSILGLLKSSVAQGGAVPTVSIPADGTGSSKAWTAKTSELIIRDLDLIVRTVRQNTKMIEEVTTILLPLEAWGVANSKPFSVTGGSDKTVLQWWKANNPGIEVLALNELATAGASSVSRAMAFVRRPDKVEGQIPQDYEQLPPQPKNLKFMVPCHSRCAGVIWYKPWSAVYGDGI